MDVEREERGEADRRSPLASAVPPCERPRDVDERERQRHRTVDQRAGCSSENGHRNAIPRAEHDSRYRCSDHVQIQRQMECSHHCVTDSIDEDARAHDTEEGKYSTWG